MNLDKFEKIDGREALRRLADGQRVYDNYGWHWEMSEDGIVSYVKDEKKFLSEIHLATFSTHKYLYIPKPFDVRQAMLDKPDEWVGIVEKPNGGYLKIGFDSKRFRAVAAEPTFDGKPDDLKKGVYLIDASYIDHCEDFSLWGDDL